MVRQAHHDVVRLAHPYERGTMVRQAHHDVVRLAHPYERGAMVRQAHHDVVRQAHHEMVDKLNMTLIQGRLTDT